MVHQRYCWIRRKALANSPGWTCDTILTWQTASRWKWSLSGSLRGRNCVTQTPYQWTAHQLNSQKYFLKRHCTKNALDVKKKPFPFLDKSFPNWPQKCKYVVNSYLGVCRKWNIYPLTKVFIQYKLHLTILFRPYWVALTSFCFCESFDQSRATR